MKRLLAATTVALAVLAGCGTDTCTSSPAKLADSLQTSCTLKPGATATFTVPLCSRCNDTSPGCQAEVVGNQIEIQPVVQQCQENSGCATAGCNAAAQSATCTVTTPAASGSYTLAVVGDSLVQGTVTLDSSTGNTSCSL